MFVFTNARATQFQPGPSAPILRELLKSLEDQSNTTVPFARENSFLFDSEAFRFLALCKNGVEHSSIEKQDYSRSWDYSIKEFNRLMSRIIKCDKHATRDTLSLNEAQQLIRKLSRPIGEITRLIQENVQLAQQHRENVLTNSTSTPQVLPQSDAKVVSLDYPRTVCAHEKCTKFIIVNGIKIMDYASHCHPHCYLTGVEKEVIGHEVLKDCDAIDQLLRTCKVCGCGWQEHMHITYEFQKFMTDVNISTSNNSQSVIAAIEKHIKDLKTEEEAIVKVCTQLTQFLRANALNPLNDDILDYIQHFIREEQLKKSAGAQNDGVITGLQNLLANYRHEMNILQQTMKISQISLTTNSSDSTNIVQTEDIFLLVGTLYRLPINGAKIRAQVDELKRVQQKFSQNREQTVNLPTEANSSSVMADLEYILA